MSPCGLQLALHNLDLGSWGWGPVNRAWALAMARRNASNSRVRVAVIGYCAGAPWGPMDYLTAADGGLVQVIGFDVTGARRGDPVVCRGPYDISTAATRFVNSQWR
jgi:hypothetical protein